MRSTILSIILSLTFLSSAMSLSVARSMNIGLDQCNNVDQIKNSAPLSIFFAAKLKDEIPNIIMSASVAIPCKEIDNFKVIVEFKGREHSYSELGDPEVVSEESSVSQTMSLDQLHQYWSDVIGKKKCVIVGLEVESYMQGAKITIHAVGMNLVAKLEAYGVTYDESVYNYELIKKVVKQKDTQIKQLVTTIPLDSFGSNFTEQMRNQLMAQLSNGEKEIVQTDNQGNRYVVKVKQEIFRNVSSQKYI